MGSFNTYCALTFQTVAPKERVVIIPIHKNFGWEKTELSHKDSIITEMSHIAESGCYADSLYVPFSLGIRGVYDDYGQFIFDDDKENLDNIKYLLNLLSRRGFKTLEGENQYHDFGFDANQILNDLDGTKESILDAMSTVIEVGYRENRIYISDYNRNSMQLAFAVIHESAYDKAIERQSKSKGWDGLVFTERLKSRFTDMVNMAMSASLYYAMICKEENFTATREHLISVVCENVDFSVQYSRDFFRHTGINNIHLHPMFAETVGCAGADFILGVASSCEDAFQFLAAIEESKTEFYEVINHALLENFVSQFFFDHVIFCSFIAGTNWRWQPSLYAGQDYDNSDGNKYLSLLKEVAKEIEKNRKIRWGE